MGDPLFPDRPLPLLPLSTSERVLQLQLRYFTVYQNLELRTLPSFN